MSWPDPSHVSSAEYNPSVGPPETEADNQAYTDLLKSLENLTTAEIQQAQYPTPSFALPLQYLLFHSLQSSSSQPFSSSPPTYTNSLPLPPPQEWPELSRGRNARSAPKAKWMKFVDTLEWLVNAEIPKEDRICPFCWGEFALEVEEDEEDEEVSEDGKEDSVFGDGEWMEETYVDLHWEIDAGYQIFGGPGAEAIITPTLNSAATAPESFMGFLGSVVNDENEDGYEAEDGQDSSFGPASSEIQDRSVRGADEGISLPLESERLGKRHYAVKLPCGHLFGHMCLVRMLKSGERACPKCRKDIT